MPNFISSPPGSSLPRLSIAAAARFCLCQPCRAEKRSCGASPSRTETVGEEKYIGASLHPRLVVRRDWTQCCGSFLRVSGAGAAPCRFAPPTSSSALQLNLDEGVLERVRVDDVVVHAGLAGV